MKKLKEIIYEEVCEVVNDNYTINLKNILENKGIEVQSMYIEDPAKFLNDKEFHIYIETNKVNFTHKVEYTFEDMETTIENILKVIKEEEKKRGY